VSGTVAERKRLIRVTAGNLRNSHIYITGHYDFFPTDCIGGSCRSERGMPVRIRLDGLNITIETDIPRDANTGKPRREFRARKWVREFFRHHDTHTGDVLAIEKVGERDYRLYPFQTASERNQDWREVISTAPEGDGPTVLEVFAGCGGMALGFKRAGFRTVLAVEWDADACKSLRANITERVAQCAIEEMHEFPKADVVAGGPPCQGFSNLGDRVPYDPRKQFWCLSLQPAGHAQSSTLVLDDATNRKRVRKTYSTK